MWRSMHEVLMELSEQETELAARQAFAAGRDKLNPRLIRHGRPSKHREMRPPRDIFRDPLPDRWRVAS